MAELFRVKDLQELIDRRPGPVVSIFLPTHRTSDRSQRQDAIRLRNLIGDAEGQLGASGLRGPDVDALLAPARDLLDDGVFWTHQGDGLAIHLADGWSRIHRLPVTVPETVVVAERCHVRPLLDLVSADRRFFLLALSQADARLFVGSRQGVDEVDLGGSPRSLADVLQYDDLEKMQNLHVASRGGAGSRPVFHGHGSGGEVDLVLRERWIASLAEGVEQVLRDEDAPLVLAGVAHECALFRRTTAYRNVAADGIDGNPEHLSPEVLRERAWSVIEPMIERDRRAAAEQFLESAGRGSGAVSDVPGVLRASLEGRVERLFVDASTHVWGTVDEDTGQVVIADGGNGPGMEDLLDRAALETLTTSGTVHVVPAGEVPGPGPAAALLRY